MRSPRERARLDLAGLRCEGRHGAYAGEREVTRAFLVDVSLAGEVDADDVELVTDAARQAVAAHSRALLERVAVDVADAILARAPRVQTVTVRVAKPDPPGLDAACEAVTLTRERSRTR